MLKTFSIQVIACIVFLLYLSSCKKSIETIIDTKTIRDTIRLIDTLDVDRPINVKATKGACGSKIIIAWTPMPLAKKYQIWKFDSSIQKYIFLKELADTIFEDVMVKNTLTKKLL